MNVYITRTSKQMIGNVSMRITELQEIIDGDISWEFDYIKYDKRLLKKVVM